MAGALHKQGEAKVNGFVTQVLDSVAVPPDQDGGVRPVATLAKSVGNIAQTWSAPRSWRAWLRLQWGWRVVSWFLKA